MSLRFTRGDHGSDGSGENTSVPLAPLIDMIFILLIFFLVTASFSRDTGIEVDKPEATSSSILPKEHPLISIRENGSIHVGKQPVKLDAVSYRLKQEFQRKGSRKVVIAADREVKTELLVQVIDYCQKAGAKNVSIATRKTSQ